MLEFSLSILFGLSFIALKILAGHVGCIFNETSYGLGRGSKPCPSDTWPTFPPSLILLWGIGYTLAVIGIKNYGRNSKRTYT